MSTIGFVYNSETRIRIETLMRTEKVSLILSKNWSDGPRSSEKKF